MEYRFFLGSVSGITIRRSTLKSVTLIKRFSSHSSLTYLEGMLNNFKLCRHKFYSRLQISPCTEGYGIGIVYESKNCCKQNLYTFLLNNQKLSVSVMSAFLFAVNRINLNYGKEDNSRKVNNCYIHMKNSVNGR